MSVVFRFYLHALHKVVRAFCFYGILLTVQLSRTLYKGILKKGYQCRKVVRS